MIRVCQWFSLGTGRTFPANFQDVWILAFPDYACMFPVRTDPVVVATRARVVLQVFQPGSGNCILQGKGKLVTGSPGPCKVVQLHHDICQGLS